MSSEVKAQQEIFLKQQRLLLLKELVSKSAAVGVVFMSDFNTDFVFSCDTSCMSADAVRLPRSHLQLLS